jgi:hypothetical protein
VPGQGIRQKIDRITVQPLRVEVTVTAAGWLLPAGLPPRIGDSLRAGQGHCENESAGQNHRGCQRIADIQAAIDAIRSHSQRSDLSDDLVFDAVRIRLLKIGEAVKALPDDLLATQPSTHGGSSPACVTT